MKDKNLPVLFLHKNKKRGDLSNVWAMGWGWGSLLRSGSLARCQKQKDRRLWTDFHVYTSSITYGLMELIAS